MNFVITADMWSTKDTVFAQEKLQSLEEFLKISKTCIVKKGKFVTQTVFLLYLQPILEITFVLICEREVFFNI